jgi:hypothetical protein
MPDDDSGSPHKLAHSDRSLQRYNCIAEGAKLSCAGFVHHHGSPISHETKAGFSRRSKVGELFEHSGPSPEFIRRWGENGE